METFRRHNVTWEFRCFPAPERGDIVSVISLVHSFCLRQLCSLLVGFFPACSRLRRVQAGRSMTRLCEGGCHQVWGVGLLRLQSAVVMLYRKHLAFLQSTARSFWDSNVSRWFSSKLTCMLFNGLPNIGLASWTSLYFMYYTAKLVTEAGALGYRWPSHPTYAKNTTYAQIRMMVEAFKLRFWGKRVLTSGWILIGAW